MDRSTIGPIGPTGLEYEFEEEIETTVRARRNANSRPVVWTVGKRGTVFASEPEIEDVDIFKDITHLYRDRTTGKKRGRREWATTFWVSGRTRRDFSRRAKTPRSPRRTFSGAVATRFSGRTSSTAKTGSEIPGRGTSILSCRRTCGSNTWEADDPLSDRRVDRRGMTRKENSEGLSGPSGLSDGEANERPDRRERPERRDDDSACVRFALRHGEKLDEKTLCRLSAVADSIKKKGNGTPPNDHRFRIF